MQEKESEFSNAHAPAYLKYVKECITVTFVRLEEASSPDAQPLQLVLLPSLSYKQTCLALAKALKVLATSHQESLPLQSVFALRMLQLSLQMCSMRCPEAESGSFPRRSWAYSRF